ncbi:MAG: hypothetical protein AAF216_08080 [Pseudomonadota bacterium]
MKWIALSLWTILAVIVAFPVMYIVAWSNWSDGWEGGIPAFLLVFGLGLVHWRKLRKYD